MRIEYNQAAKQVIPFQSQEIFSFVEENAKDMDSKTVQSFGEEWEKFSSFTKEEIEKVGDEYFDILPSTLLNQKSYVLDVGCGTGRWSKYLADKVGFIECIDPSDAIFSAKHLLRQNDNVRITKASVGNIPFGDNTFDLVMSIGVLHHIPNTHQGIKVCIDKVKKGGYFYVYLYYNLDNRGKLYRLLFDLSTLIRRLISNLPSFIKKIACDLIAFFVYVPLVFFGVITKIIFGNVYKKLPLSYYVGKSLNIIRNDALDRFGTPLEKRYSKQQINQILKEAGLTNIQFSENPPYWHVIGQKK